MTYSKSLNLINYIFDNLLILYINNKIEISFDDKTITIFSDQFRLYIDKNKDIILNISGNSVNVKFLNIKFYRFYQDLELIEFILINNVIDQINYNIENYD